MAMMLGGCMQAGTATANFFAMFSGQEIVTDVVYGTESRQKINLYLPKGTQPTDQKPVVIFFYGGGWKSGSKDMYRFAAEPYTSAGYIVVIPDYAKYPDYKYPTFAEDGAESVAWIKKHISTYGGDASNMFILGHSAGAHLGALLLTNKQFLHAAGADRSGILGFAGLAGPYDFVPTDPDFVAIFAPAGGDARSAMPATYVDGSEPPMLLLYGATDDVVGKQNIEHMARQIKAHHGIVESKIYDDVGHIGIIAALAKPTRSKAPVVNDTLTFFAKYKK